MDTHNFVDSLTSPKHIPSSSNTRRTNNNILNTPASSVISPTDVDKEFLNFFMLASHAEDNDFSMAAASNGFSNGSSNSVPRNHVGGGGGGNAHHANLLMNSFSSSPAATTALSSFARGSPVDSVQSAPRLSSSSSAPAAAAASGVNGGAFPGLLPPHVFSNPTVQHPQMQQQQQVSGRKARVSATASGIGRNSHGSSAVASSSSSRRSSGRGSASLKAVAPKPVPIRPASNPMPVPHVPATNPLNFPASAMEFHGMPFAFSHIASSAPLPIVDSRNLHVMSSTLPVALNVRSSGPVSTEFDDDDDDIDGDSDAGMMVDEQQQQQAGENGSRPPGRKRKERKAELARESRKKKKAYVEELEEKVKQLETRVAELQTQHDRSMVKRRSVSSLYDENDRLKHQKQLVQMMAELVSKPRIQDVEADLLKDHVQMFIETSREAQSQVEYNIDRVEDIISPTLQIKFTLWGLDQSDDFYDAPAGLWTSLLCDEVGLSVEQISKLKSFRTKMHSHRQELRHVEELLIGLREKCGVHLDRFNKEMDKLHGILSAVQLAKFYVWIEQNDWCMQMLNSMWTSPS
eukprot:TRINITY_DN18130_c0_g1_i1.p1 TRINITY_DN18130_c0_g1~~TRINITY_DN18130_c0_g1_i1.p1  ORF type:complete len:591 (-),score=102.29 TRINITY_DN18130_c0_g1_i1:680-2404(-)